MTRTEIDWSECPIIQRDQQKLHGAPTIRGMRLTPDTIVEHFSAGLTVAQIRELFPSVTDDDIRAVLNYAIKQGRLEGPVR